MVSEARKLNLIEKVLKIDNEALLTQVEALLKGASAPEEKLKLSKKYRGALKLSDNQRQDLQKHLQDVRNEWERDI